MVCGSDPSNVDLGVKLWSSLGGGGGRGRGSGRKEIGKPPALKQNETTKQHTNNETTHRPFDSPARWGFALLLVLTLEEQEIPS